MAANVERQISEECLAGRIRILNRVVSGILDARLRPIGVRSSQFGILTVVAARGPLAPTDVCRIMHLDKSTLSRDLERLVAQGWIESTPGPGRGRRLSITDAGLALLSKAKPAWDEAQTEVQQVLGESLAREVYKTVEQLRLRGVEKS
ncbi:MarR family winged helix-turn-helix transcriptional regulator [Paludisphaera rhizosphaerae]|uniref:MarR family winged helix-turn-helix transcriptional regulator n=1 Tax=Paludisphaera rhizosphaerae TaxID=2711216 RepID=UPI00197EFF50|nr:MarR family winged helix-turn-helix transcriptional regulator [Paludisphaera rhizosphaerae]